MESREERAAKLLQENSSSKRAKDRYGCPYLLVRGQRTKAEYAVGIRTADVILLKPRTRFCVKARGAIPCADNALTLALHIQHNERHFLSRAVSASVAPRFALHLLRAGALDNFAVFIFLSEVAICAMLGIFLSKAFLFIFR